MRKSKKTTQLSPWQFNYQIIREGYKETLLAILKMPIYKHEKKGVSYEKSNYRKASQVDSQ